MVIHCITVLSVEMFNPVRSVFLVIESFIFYFPSASSISLTHCRWYFSLFLLSPLYIHIKIYSWFSFTTVSGFSTNLGLLFYTQSVIFFTITIRIVIWTRCYIVDLLLLKKIKLYFVQKICTSCK